MASTRFYDDDARIKKKLEESLNVGLYHLDTPGNGLHVPFMEDPHLRLQKWGANLRNDTIGISNDLLGLDRKLKSDKDLYTKYTPATSQNVYPVMNPFVDESRTTHPAWTFREKHPERWQFLFHQTQQKVEVPFQYNESTRILEKDKFRHTNNNA